MNCQLCQKELDAYMVGRLPGDTKVRIEAHLNRCEECAGFYNLQILADRIIHQEKELQSNPFLSTRIMARIEGSEIAAQQSVPVFKGILRPAWVITSLAAAIFLGILIGNIYKPVIAAAALTEELALIDDAVIESIDLFSNE